MKKKISSIEIAHFRGIPKTLKIDLWKRSPDKPISLVVFGDNGTGKSSIIPRYCYPSAPTVIIFQYKKHDKVNR